MSFRRFIPARFIIIGVCIISSALVVTALTGCAGYRDRVIGEGEHEMVFSNDGNIAVPVTVRWVSGQQHIKTETFTVYTTGTVTLLTIPRLSYEIELDPDCESESSAAPASVPENQVIDLRQR